MPGRRIAPAALFDEEPEQQQQQQQQQQQPEVDLLGGALEDTHVGYD